jgi:C-terminal processing protease CtpA/Prc
VIILRRQHIVLSASLFLVCISAAGQETEAGRLIAAGKLWTSVKYFHPWLAYRDIDWDAAWVQAYPKIKSATDRQMYAEAVERMLAPLADPITRLVLSPAPASGEQGSTLVRWEPGSVLVVTVPNSGDWPAIAKKLRETQDDLRKATAVVFDIRNASEAFPFALSLSGVDHVLSNHAVAAPVQRTRLHSGLASEGASSGGYYSAFQVRDGERFEPGPGATQKIVVFLASERAYVPGIALALQADGKAAIIGEGPVTEDRLVDTAKVQLPYGLEAHVRLGELLYPDGTTGFAPDIIAHEGEGLTTALAAAVRPVPSKRPERIRVPTGPSRGLQSRYPETQYPAPAYRTLACLLIWANHEYFYPYKRLMGEDWTSVLTEFLPKLDVAKDEREFHLGVAEMLTHVHDTHSGARSKILDQFYGEAAPPVVLRWIEESPVVARVLDQRAVQAVGIAVGDTILGIDGNDVAIRIHELSSHYSASTPQALMWKVCSGLLSGPPGSQASLKVRKPGGAVVNAVLTRKSEYRRPMSEGSPGEVVRLLLGNIGYVDLNRLSVSMVEEMFEKLKNTRAIIFDMRGYPQGTAWSIAPRLTEAKSPTAALFSRPIAMGPEAVPGESTETTTYSFTQPLPPTDKWRYKGQTLMLIDERTISQAEHTGLLFEAANGTKFVGTPTSGANGDVTTFSVSGEITVSMTGHEVRHADGRPLQRVGLQPNVRVAPTIAAIAAGRDEVLDRAVQFITTGK